MSRWSKWAKRAGAVAATGFAVGITAVGAATVDFDKSMRNVNSIAQLNERQFQKLQKSVLGLAGPTAQAPKTIADGMYDLVSSGFSAGEALQIVEKSAKAATAGLTTAEVSTQAVAAVLNAYHLPASKAGKVSDQLFRTVDRGVISFEDLASNVGDVLPFASSLGVGLDQVGASIATMTKAGISAPETMTRVKNVMVAMLKPGEGLKKAIKDLGYESGEQLVKTKGFQGGLEALIGTTDGSKKAVAKLFPEIRAMGGALALTGKNAKGARDDLKGMENASGATAKALSEQSKSISYAWNQIKAKVTAAAIGIGSQAVPAIMQFVGEVRTGTGTGGDFRHAIENIGAAIGPIAVVIGQASLAIGKLGLDFAQTQTAMVLVGAAVGALTGRLVGLGVAFAAGKIIPFAAAVARTVSVLQSAIAVSGGLRTAMILLTASTRGLTVAMASTGIGALAIIAGTAIGAMVGFGRASDDSADAQRDLASAIKGTHDALDAIANADLDAKQAKIDHRAAVANLKDAEAQLDAVRKNPKATAADRERAEIAVANARVDLSRKTRAMRNSERDYQDTVRSGMSDAQRNVDELRAHRDEKRKSRDETRKGIDKLKDEIATMQRTGTTAKQLKPKLQELREKQSQVRDQTTALKDAQGELNTAMRGVRNTAASAAPKIANFGDKLKGLKPFTKVELELIASGAPALKDLTDFLPKPKKPKKNRQGGWATFQWGGMVPSLLSPGEVGVLPDGSSFTVPGARVAADTYPMMLPQGTAVLTDHGLQLAAMGWPLNSVIANQAPHFGDGGIVGATAGAASLRAAGVKDPRQLVVMTATGGRESRWDPKAVGTNRDRSGRVTSQDHGWLQANDKTWAATMGKLWGQRYTFEGGSEIAKRIADKQGPAAWSLNGWTSDSTIAPFMSTAQKAVKRAMAGKGFSYTRVNQPKITRPLLGNMLSPLVNDALMGGIEAGRTGAGRLPLLTEVLEGIVPESEDRPSREQVSVSGRDLGIAASGSTGRRIQRMAETAEAIAAKKMAYQYGGFGNPSYDCSGYASAVANAGGLMSGRTDTLGFKNFGLPGKGRNVTFGIRGGAGKTGHMMFKIGNQHYESGGGHGPARVSGWNGSFDTWRHPKFRKGGMVGRMLPPSPEGRRHLEGIASRKRVPVASLLDPQSKAFVGWGMANPRKPKKKVLTVAQLVKMLGGSPGTAGADKLTRKLAGRVEGASFAKLLGGQRQAKAQIRGMAKNGFTGSERIQARRLRGALSLLQDEQGRRIGFPLGLSDQDQDRISRADSRLPNFLTVQGIDPESTHGLEVQQFAQRAALDTLRQRQVGNRRALRLAKRTGNKDAIATAQAEFDEVADQMLGLKASIIDLDKSIKESMPTREDFANRDLAMAGLTETLADDKGALQTLIGLAEQQLAAALKTADPRDDIEAANNLKGLRDQMESLTNEIANANEVQRQRDDINKEIVENQRKIIALAGQGKLIEAAVAAMLDGTLGARMATTQRLAGGPAPFR